MFWVPSHEHGGTQAPWGPPPTIARVAGEEPHHTLAPSNAVRWSPPGRSMSTDASRMGAVCCAANTGFRLGVTATPAVRRGGKAANR
jgi:hypothetical protein